MEKKYSKMLFAVVRDKMPLYPQETYQLRLMSFPLSYPFFSLVAGRGFNNIS
jgi:hypothetical protein